MMCSYRGENLLLQEIILNMETVYALQQIDSLFVDSMLKEILLSLRVALQQDISTLMCKTQRELEVLVECVDYVENKINEFTMAHNELVG